MCTGDGRAKNVFSGRSAHSEKALNVLRVTVPQ